MYAFASAGYAEIKATNDTDNKNKTKKTEIAREILKRVGTL